MAAADPSAAPDPRAIEALLAFWADAGVDVALGDAPVDRLAAPPPRVVPPMPARAGSLPAPAAADPKPARPPVDAVDLPALEAAVAAFDGCALRAAASARAVFAHLPSRADVVVVAEAPSPEDEAAGAPFSGPAGRLVRALLEHAGLGDRAILTQTVFWRPAGGASPTAADQAACRPFLERLVALARPRALLVMGDAAARGFLGLDAPILKARGGWTEWTGVHEPVTTPALATLSPAFLLARPAMRKAAWGDILSLAARVDLGGSGR